MRVRRAFGFIDLCGFTSLTSAHGDEEAVTHLGAFRLAVRETCSRRGVRVAKWLGDGAMLVCVEEAPLVAAVLELEHRISGSSLALRAGVTVGDVILFEGDDYIGNAVNLAARLCDMASPHEVLASCEMPPFAPDWVQCVDLGERPVRGVGQVRIVELSACPHGDSYVTDPVCRMELPADRVSVSRQLPDGEVVGFCSESCAETWDGRRRAPDRGLMV